MDEAPIAPCASISTSITTASRSSFSPSDVRSVLSRSGSIGKTVTPVYTEVAYEGPPYAAYAGPFLTETLPLLRTLGEPGAVRVVFWFDS